jgi:hypothetical protein
MEKENTPADIRLINRLYIDKIIINAAQTVD